MSADAPLPKLWLLRSLEIETDSEGGPTQQVRSVLGALLQAADELKSTDEPKAELARRLTGYGERLRRAVPDLPLVHYWLDRALARVDVGSEAVAMDIAVAQAALEQVAVRVAQAGEPLFPPGQRMLTLGYSDAVLAMLRRYGDRLEAITVSEGRPRNSGVRLAREVAEHGLPVRLITEAQMELYLPDIGVAMVSARSILPDGSAVARVGASVVARLCAAHGVPFYVVADQARWVAEGSEGTRFVRVRRSSTEVCAGAHPGVLVSNVAYDVTPPELITGYVTEAGIRRDATSRSAPGPRGASPALV